mmetsp:Transcript_7787/g.17129  ORF Transcript_7787/g.17129 Transcript_7787/m.17129 type:complete len:223 (-) Transcript_7787:465-1133(-)
MAAMEHAARVRAHVTALNRQRATQPLKPSAAALVLTARVQRDVKREHGTVSVRRQEGLAARSVVLDHEGVSHAERARVGQRASKRCAEKRVDGREKSIVEPAASKRQLLQRHIGRRVVEVPLRRPAAHLARDGLAFSDDRVALLLRKERERRREDERQRRYARLAGREHCAVRLKLGGAERTEHCLRIHRSKGSHRLLVGDVVTLGHHARHPRAPCTHACRK